MANHLNINKQGILVTINSNQKERIIHTATTELGLDVETKLTKTSQTKVELKMIIFRGDGLPKKPTELETLHVGNPKPDIKL